MADPILDCLNSAQREAVTHPGRHLLVFAGPGTGKTRVITHRIAYLVLRQGLDPETILAITFTNKAAMEMKTRLAGLLGDAVGQPWAGTFHAFAHWMLRRHPGSSKFPRDFVIYDRDDQRSLMRDICSETDLGASRAGVLLDIIQRLKDDLMDAHSYAIHTDVSSDPNRSQIAKIYLAYQEALRNRGALDFGDLLLEANHLLRESPEILKSYQERFGFIFVDEYQDVNRAQYAMIKALAGGGATLTCVADDDQVIYEWRNANPRYTLDFDKEFQGAASITLTQNYRSSPDILKTSGRLIAHNEVRKNKELTATRSPGPGPEVMALGDEKEEARAVACRIKELMEEGTQPAQIAVFYRINAQSRNFEIELRAQGIPYRLIGALGFYARREIKDILAFARILVSPKDEVSLVRVLTNFGAFSLTKDALSRLKEKAKSQAKGFFDVLTDASILPVEGISQRALKKIGRFLSLYNPLRLQVREPNSMAKILGGIVSGSDYLKELEEERVWNIEELIETTREYERENPGVDLGGYLNHTSLLASVSLDNTRGDRPAGSPYGSQGQAAGVNLMTVHLAKGLEFETVFLTGLEEGLFPFKISRDFPGEMEEERRLCYVGMTRAKNHLFLTHSQRRVIFGSQASRRPSRFLFEAGLLAQDEAAGPRLTRGLRVKHPLYGEGRVVAVSGGEDDAKVTVAFLAGSTRKFLFKVAPLEIL